MYTKEQRNKIYKKMLSRYKNNGIYHNIIRWDGGEYFKTEGLCLCLEYVTRSHYTKIIEFPELACPPNRERKLPFYWWDLKEEGYLQRVSLLLEAIKKTN